MKLATLFVGLNKQTVIRQFAWYTPIYMHVWWFPVSLATTSEVLEACMQLSLACTRSPHAPESMSYPSSHSEQTSLIWEQALQSAIVHISHLSPPQLPTHEQLGLTLPTAREQLPWLAHGLGEQGSEQIEKQIIQLHSQSIFLFR